jgi:hypothetical protein
LDSVALLILDPFRLGFPLRLGRGNLGPRGKTGYFDALDSRAGLRLRFGLHGVHGRRFRLREV